MIIHQHGGLLPCSTSTTLDLFFYSSVRTLEYRLGISLLSYLTSPTTSHLRLLPLSLQPVVACVIKQNVGRGSGKIPVSDDECPHAELVTTTSIVVGTSDGIVRFLSGPKTRHCGRFVSLSEDGVLSILELLGYRSSQVTRFFLYRWLHRTTCALPMSVCLRRRGTDTRRSYPLTKWDSAFSGWIGERFSEG